ncbi:MAG: ABC transporter substrate-binding protein [Deltaproteobacteria bacterium]|nr:ABC transporter substrate-binding protein [Deltaproteobacteria bacterium]
MKKMIWGVLVLLVLAPFASVQAKTYNVSVSQFVEHPALDAVLKGFQDYMKENNVDVKYTVHNAQANMATAGQIGTQIMGEKPDLIIAIATPSAQTCAQALQKAPHMQKTPMLFTAVTDPVMAGLVKDLNRPGGNITGVSDMLPLGEHMQMIREFLPGMKKLGVLYNSGETNSISSVKLLREVGQKMGYEVVDATVSKTSEVYQAAKSLVGKVDAVFVPTDNTVVESLESAVKVCAENDLPLFSADVDSVKRGSVAAMGFDYYKHGRQTGAMAKRILDGVDPGKTPVETQKELKLHINLKSAKDMGVRVPDSLLKTADMVYK